MTAADTDWGWKFLARCVEVDREMFFPEKGESAREAKKVCSQCEVKNECLAEALADESTRGVWGGTTDRERTQMRRPLRIVKGHQ